MANHNRTILNLLSLLCLLALPSPTPAQNDAKKPPVKAGKKETGKPGEADPLQTQRRADAVSLVTSLADEARGYRDSALRPRVLARAADVLWDADNETARALFRRAWEAAEKGDAEEATSGAKDGAQPMVTALRRMSGHDLRSEVLTLAARRDRALGEEFLSKLKDGAKRESEDSGGDAGARNGAGGWSGSEAAAKRLQTARQLLDDGEVERALEFAAPVLNQVNAKTIGFLSALRAKRAEEADRRFVFLLARAEADPASDANTVSGLSSYAFTPALYIAFSPSGGATWSREAETDAPPNLPPAIRARFFQSAASILLRPSPPPDQDKTTSGRLGKYMVIKRLLPLFEQNAPDAATALRAQLAALSGDMPVNERSDDDSLLTESLRPAETPDGAYRKMEDRLDRAKTSRERDSIYAEAAASLADQGDARAQEAAGKIEDSARREQVRQYVDLQFVQLAIRKKDASEAGRLAGAGRLTHAQRAWAYTEAARLLLNSQRPRALEFLEEAAGAARRIDDADPDRAHTLVGVATQFAVADRARAWGVMGEAVKSANSAEGFTGENAQLHFPLATGSGVKIISIGGQDFGLSGVLRSLAGDDLQRSIELARGFKNEAPRAAATLAIAAAVLGK